VRGITTMMIGEKCAELMAADQRRGAKVLSGPAPA
jgi:hypothetical protein